MLISLQDKYFPKIRIRKKYSNRKPWLSDGLRNSIRNKNKLYYKYEKIPPVKNASSYKSFRNKLNHVLKIAEKKYYRDLIIYHKGNTRKSWSIIKSIINEHRKSNVQCKFKLNNGIATDDKNEKGHIRIFQHFLAATKQLYECSVRLSVCLSVCPSHLFDYVTIIVSSWNFQELSPRARVRSMQRSRSEVKGQGHRGHNPT